MRIYTLLLLAIPAVLAAGEGSSAAELRTRKVADRPAECSVAGLNIERLAHVATINIDYPKGESEELGEGWVRVIYTLGANAALAHLEIVDAMGTPAYGKALQEALEKATFTAAVVNRKAVEANNYYDVLFAIEGNNRALVHYHGFSETYDTAHRQRAQGKYEESIATVFQSFADPLNMYEIATLSHGLALSYIGLKDYRRALIHAKHAAMERGRFLANDARPYAQATLTWLEAKNNNQREAVCDFAWLKQSLPSYTPDADTVARIEQARAELVGSGAVRTEIELVDRGRSDVPSGWEHEAIRRAFRFEHVSANSGKFRATCQTGTKEGTVSEGGQWTLEPSGGECTLYFYGAPGTKFDLVEY